VGGRVTGGGLVFLGGVDRGGRGGGEGGGKAEGEALIGNYSEQTSQPSTFDAAAPTRQWAF